MTLSKARVLKVLLIQPSARSGVRTLFSIYNTDEGIGFKPPVGLLSIASTIHAMSGHHAEILDCQLEDVHEGNILDYVTQPYDVVGISAWTDFWYQASAMASKIKAAFPLTHINIGGPQVNIFPREVLAFPAVDSIILGDGEYPMLALLGHLADGSSLPAGSGVYRRESQSESFEPYVCRDLNSLPVPDRTLLPLDRYTSVLSPSKRVTSAVSSRGCPFQCVYCKMAYQRPVARSAAHIVRELKDIEALGIAEVEFYDDTFNWDHRRTRQICEQIIQQKIKLRWAIRDRVDRVTPEIYALLRKAGCYRVHLGIESGVDRVLASARKSITVAQARNAVRIAKAHGFTVLTYFMYGIPGEALEDARETLRFALELDSDYAEFSITVPYPGTEAYESALKKGTIPTDYWRAFARNPEPDFMIPYVFEDTISREMLLQIRDESIRRFYFRPRYMLRELFKIRTWSELVRKVKMAIGLLDVLRRKLVR